MKFYSKTITLRTVLRASDASQPQGVRCPDEKIGSSQKLNKSRLAGNSRKRRQKVEDSLTVDRIMWDVSVTEAETNWTKKGERMGGGSGEQDLQS